jgi:RNA-directed DNA polymerase
MSLSRPYLFDRLCDPRELERAWLEVLAHYAKSRVPDELRSFDRQRGKEIRRLSDSLREKTFLPEPASLILIPKPNHPGEQRPITLVRPDDRVVLTSLNRVLSPLFERRFLAHSYAYRPRRGASAAIEQVTRCIRQGLTKRPRATSTTSSPASTAAVS